MKLHVRPGLEMEKWFQVLHIGPYEVNDKNANFSKFSLKNDYENMTILVTMIFVLISRNGMSNLDYQMIGNATHDRQIAGDR